MSSANQRHPVSAALVPAFAVVCSVSILGAVASACSSGDQGAPQPSNDASSPDADAAVDTSASDGPTACDASLQVCNGACVDLTSDREHCGACSIACATDHFCLAGQCRSCSDEGKVACGGTCADLSSDTANCGACAKACTAGKQCQDGTCIASCPDGGSSCAGQCIDTANDPNNCGGCGHGCAAGQTCGGGACLCGDASTVACGATCVDPSTDKQHCGATPGCGVNAGYSGEPCLASGYCGAGACHLCQSWSPAWTGALSQKNLSSIPTFAAADFNNDTHPDLAVLRRDTGTVTIYGGLPDATFSAGATYSPGVGGAAIAVGDFDADGNKDFAVGNRLTKTTSTVLVFKGNGAGTFVPGPTVARQTPANGIVAGDLNGDGRDDLVVEGGSAAADVRVYLSLAKGTFAVGDDFSGLLQSLSGSSYGTFALSDVDGDTHLDLVVLTAGPALVLFGKGDGTFEAPWVSPRGYDGSFAGLLVGDTNGDGKPDLLWRGAQGGWWLALGQGARSWQAPSALSSGYPAVLGDVTGDGILDVVSTAYVPAVLWVRAGHGDGTFLPTVSFPFGDESGDTLYAHDLNGDGYVDVVGTTFKAVVVVQGSKSTEVECP
jgi:hypothetical protein